MLQSDFTKLLLARLSSESWGLGELVYFLKGQRGFTKPGMRKEFKVPYLELLTLRYFSRMEHLLSISDERGYGAT